MTNIKWEICRLLLLGRSLFTYIQRLVRPLSLVPSIRNDETIIGNLLPSTLLLLFPKSADFLPKHVHNIPSPF